MTMLTLLLDGLIDQAMARTRTRNVTGMVTGSPTAFSSNRRAGAAAWLVPSPLNCAIGLRSVPIGPQRDAP